MKKIEKYKISLFLMLLLFTSSALADDFTKKYKKEFNVNSESTLELSNKYGNVHVENWDQNKVFIEVVITIRKANEKKANSIFKKIKIEFSSEDNIHKATTEIIESISGSFSIDYNVKMPTAMNLKLTNKYGNIFVDQIDGHALIIGKYGDLRINKLTRGNVKPINQIYLGYTGGGSLVSEANWLKIVVKYSDIEIKTAKALMIDSKYSKVQIDKVRSVVAESKYDKPYEIGEITNFVVTSGAYSSYEIGILHKKLDAIVKYSSFSIENVTDDFESIDLQMKYGNIDISIAEKASYNLKADVEYGSIDYVHSKNMNKIADNTDVSIFGLVGNNKSTKAKITVVAKYSNVEID